jgi:2-succinyl-5-enolpyruvyl-6-hydroxy-3-cyclohexene-1-carboxylate synthase
LGLFLRDASAPAYIHVQGSGHRQDPFHRVRFQVDSDVALFAEAAASQVNGPSNPAWLTAWTSASRAVGEVLDVYAAGQDQLDEILAARQVASLVPADSALFLANSMPIRDMNMHAPLGVNPVRVLANRGASGIDGNLATATGFGNALACPVTAVMGDLALLHDLNSLALVASGSHPVHVVVMNNRGGGIFHFLPVARHTSFFEEYVAAPHSFSFGGAAQMFGLMHAAPDTPASFAESYQAAVNAGTSCIIEVASNREDNLRRHRLIEERVVEALAV